KLQLIHYAGGSVQGLDPASGELLWACRAPVSQSSPAYGAGLLFADSGRYGTLGAAIDPTGRGDVSKTHVKWQVKVQGVSGASAIVVGKHVFRASGPDFIRCWNMDNGSLAFEERAP